MLLVKPVLDEPVIHTTSFHGDDKFRIVIDQLKVLNIVRDRIPGRPYVILAVDHL